jgi:hypothetical protein
VKNTTTGETGSKEFYVKINPRNLTVEASMAIDEGLWFLHKNQYRYTRPSDGLDYGGDPCDRQPVDDDGFVLGLCAELGDDGRAGNGE